ncbi:MAG: hypothetical protein ACK47B_10955 [Armatimonadota bacterium]
MFGKILVRLSELREWEIPTAPAADATKARLLLGAALAAGSAQGTWLGINAAGGFSGNLIDYQVGGSRRMVLTAAGRLGLGDTPDALLSIAVGNNNTGLFRLQHPSSNFDFALSAFQSATELAVVLGNNAYINSTGTAFPQFDATRTSAFIALNNTGSSVSGNQGIFFGCVPVAAGTSTYFGVMGQNASSHFKGVLGGSGINNIAAWNSILQIKGPANAIVSLYDTTSSVGHDLACTGGEFAIYRQDTTSGYRLRIDTSGRWTFNNNSVVTTDAYHFRWTNIALAGIVLNAPSGQTADLAQLKVNGTTVFRVFSSGKATATGGIGVGNSAAATTLGTLTKKMEVFDAAGSSLGFVPIYDAIT